jgi:hypothetical protein
MNTALEIPNAFIVDAEYVMDGRKWLYFRNGGTFAEYKAMPNALSYNGKSYLKRGWNSDNFTVAYVEGKAAISLG